ncbi:UNVERIFIED_CONTAM: Aspartyl protease 25 [Sesamum indicum]
MDAGSDLLWIQCEGCRAPGGRCFNQEGPVYPNSLSGSYYPLPCKKHKLCPPNQCINASCSYNIKYLDNTSSSGILATENFVFNSTFGKMEVLKNLVYGCGIDNRKNYGNNSNQIAGIMGLGWGSYSIFSQANSLTESRFSYCLPAISKYTQKWPNTYLRFGNDAVKQSSSSTTPLLRINDQKVYHVVLQGISVNSKTLNVSDRDFRLRGDGSGGCIIDSGTPFSRLIKPAYVVLEKTLKRYFWGQRNLELCYERKNAQGFKNLPSMTFHLKNADLVVLPEALFLVMDKISSVKGEYICLAILPSDFISVIGSYQQTNQRLIYNTKQQQLLFSPENCSKDA